MHQLINRSSPSYAYSHTNFPYTFGRYTEMRSWVENKDSYGQRFAYRCYNPIDNVWNQTKYSKYHDLVFIFQQDDGLVVDQLLDFNHLTDDQLLYMAEHYYFDDFQRHRMQLYLASLVQPTHIPLQAGQERASEAIVPIVYDPTAYVSRNVIEKKPKVKSDADADIPYIASFSPAEETTATLHLNQYKNHLHRVTGPLYEKVQQTSPEAMYDEVKETFALLDQGAIAKVQQIIMLVSQAVENMPGDEYIKKLPCTWDEWKVKEIEDRDKAIAYIQHSIAERKSHLAQLSNITGRDKPALVATQSPQPNPLGASFPFLDKLNKDVQ